jgi:tetraacyldisaccharide 4'-kinase
MNFKKPKFWDLEKPNLLSKVLTLFTFLIIINNLLPKKKIKKKHIKTICIGNIYLGGTGKTPLSICINEILKELTFKTVFIKKNYYNQKDERKMLLTRGSLINEKTRIDSLNLAIANKKQIAIFDDGLQDRSINYDISIVCFNSKKWIGNGRLIPSGPLREKITCLKKYDAIFLNGNSKNNHKIKSYIKKNFPKINLFEAEYVPLNIHQIHKKKNYIIFSGIGNPDNFKETLIDNRINIIKSLEYPDHYQYKTKDIKKIKDDAKKLNAKIITTEKDYMRLNRSNSKDIQFLKIELKIKEKKKFINFLKNKI